MQNSIEFIFLFRPLWECKNFTQAYMNKAIFTGKRRKQEKYPISKGGLYHGLVPIEKKGQNMYNWSNTVIIDCPEKKQKE